MNREEQIKIYGKIVGINDLISKKYFAMKFKDENLEKEFQIFLLKTNIRVRLFVQITFLVVLILRLFSTKIHEMEKIYFYIDLILGSLWFFIFLIYLVFHFTKKKFQKIFCYILSILISLINIYAILLTNYFYKRCRESIQIREFYILIFFSFFEISFTYEFNFFMFLYFLVINITTAIFIYIIKMPTDSGRYKEIISALLITLGCCIMKRESSLLLRDKYIQNHKLNKYFSYSFDLINSMNGLQFTLKNKQMLLYNEVFKKYLMKSNLMKSFYDNFNLSAKIQKGEKNSNDNILEMQKDIIQVNNIYKTKIRSCNENGNSEIIGNDLSEKDNVSNKFSKFFCYSNKTNYASDSFNKHFNNKTPSCNYQENSDPINILEHPDDNIYKNPQENQKINNINYFLNSLNNGEINNYQTAKNELLIDIKNIKDGKIFNVESNQIPQESTELSNKNKTISDNIKNNQHQKVNSDTSGIKYLKNNKINFRSFSKNEGILKIKEKLEDNQKPIQKHNFNYAHRITSSDKQIFQKNASSNFLLLNQYKTEVGEFFMKNIKLIKIHEKFKDFICENNNLFDIYKKIILEYNPAVLIEMFEYLGEFFIENDAKYFQVYFRKHFEYQDLIDFLIYDITEIKEAKEIEFNLKSKYFAKIAHEFKTPLNSIIGLIKNLKSIPNSCDNRENIAKNSSSNNRISYSSSNINSANKYLFTLQQIENLSNYVIFLINDVIDYSNLFTNKPYLSINNLEDYTPKSSHDENDNNSNLLSDSANKKQRINLKIEKVNLNDITQFCSDVLSTLICNKGKESFIQIKNTFDEKISDYEIFSDEFRLKQILLNFISNSAKFTKSGSIIIKSHLIKLNEEYNLESANSNSIIEINSENKAFCNSIYEYVKVSIIDTGMGMKESELKTILEYKDFNMLSSTMQINQGGSGLGLSITKCISEMLNHRIEVESTYGKGSCFSVILKARLKETKKILGTDRASLFDDFSKEDYNISNVIYDHEIENKIAEQKKLCNKYPDIDLSRKSEKYYNSHSGRTSSTKSYNIIDPIYIVHKGHSRKSKSKFGESLKTERGFVDENSIKYNWIYNVNNKIEIEKNKSNSKLNLESLNNGFMKLETHNNLFKPHEISDSLSEENIIQKFNSFNMNSDTLNTSNKANLKFIPFYNFLNKNKRDVNDNLTHIVDNQNQDMQASINKPHENSTYIDELSDKTKTLNDSDIFFSLNHKRHLIYPLGRSKNSKNIIFKRLGFNSINNQKHNNKHNIPKNLRSKNFTSPDSNLSNSQTGSNIQYNNISINIIGNDLNNNYTNSNNTPNKSQSISCINESSNASIKIIEHEICSKKKQIKDSFCHINNYSTFDGNFIRNNNLKLTDMSKRDYNPKLKINKKLIILIVDDNKFSRESLKNLIEKILCKYKLEKYYKVKEADDGANIINLVIKDQYQNNRIKCILTDESMEFINGSEAIKIIRNLEDKKKIKPIIIASITAFEDKLIKKIIANVGVNYFIPKPCSESLLVKFFEEFKIFEMEKFL